MRKERYLKKGRKKTRTPVVGTLEGRGNSILVELEKERHRIKEPVFTLGRGKAASTKKKCLRDHSVAPAATLKKGRKDSVAYKNHVKR